MAESKDNSTSKRTKPKPRKKEDKPPKSNVISTFVVGLCVTAVFAVSGLLISLNYKLSGIWIFYIALSGSFVVVFLYLRHVRYMWAFPLVSVGLCSVFVIYLASAVRDENSVRITLESPTATPSPPFGEDFGRGTLPDPWQTRKLPDGRLVVDISLAELDFYLQEKEKLEHYLDKWIYAEGKVANITIEKNGKSYIDLNKRAMDSFQYSATQLLFTSKKEIDRLRFLKRENEIQVLGQIKRHNEPASIYLDNCEFQH